MSGGRHSESGGFLGSVLTFFASIFTVLFLVRALPWFLVWAWPWWLLAFPAIFLILLAVWPRCRSRVIDSFFREHVDRDTTRFRRAFLGWLAVAGVLSGIVCGFAIGRDNLQWWLTPATLLAMAARLRALSVNEGRWAALHRALAANLFELLLIVVGVLTVYSVALWRLQGVQLDEMTLGWLTMWDRRIHETHEFLEDHELKLEQLAGFLAVILTLRIAAGARPALAGLSRATSSTLSRGTKWFGRVSTVFAVAASFTFLGTEPGGLATRINLALRDATKDYEHFQSELNAKTEQLLADAVIQNAWQARPAPLQREMVRAAQLQRETDQFDDMRKLAEQQFEIKLNSPRPEQPAAAVSTNAPPPDQPASSWTPKELRQAASDIALLPTGANKGETRDKEPDELAKEAFGKLMPSDRLFDALPLFAALKSQYPVFGEFLDAIKSSVSETSFDAMRSSVVRKVTAQRAAQPHAAIEPLVHQEVVAQTANVAVDLNRFDEAWAVAGDAEIASRQAQIRAADRSLEAEAQAKQRVILRKAALDASQRARILDSVESPGAFRLFESAGAKSQRLTAELEELGMRWPALVEPGKPLRDQLAAISAEFRDEGLLQRRSARRSVLGTWAGENSSEWSSPMEALAAVQSYCDRRIADAVGASEGSTQQSARLRSVLGDRFEDYRGQFETRRIEEASARQAEIQRQADARAPRKIQKPAREPYRAPEFRNRVEPRPRPIE